MHISGIPFSVNIRLYWKYLDTADLDIGGILLEMVGTWNTANMQIGCIANRNSTAGYGYCLYVPFYMYMRTKEGAA